MGYLPQVFTWLFAGRLRVGFRRCFHAGFGATGASLGGGACGSLIGSSSSAPLFRTLFTARLTVLPGDGIGLLAVRHGPPLVKGIRRHQAVPRNIPDVATVSARALIGLRAAFRSRVKCGTSPQASRSRRRSPASGWRRAPGPC